MTIEDMLTNKVEKTEYEDRIVAFIDILGFKNAIKNSVDHKDEFESIKTVLGFFKAWDGVHGEQTNTWDTNFIAKLLKSKSNLTDYSINDNTSCLCFSDSIIVSYKYDENTLQKTFSTLLSNLMFIGSRIMNNFLFRGGISVGKLVHKDNQIIFGPAFNDAYLLESECAIYPRIILSGKLLKELNYPNHTIHKPLYYKFLDTFDDGFVGFHQMKYLEVFQKTEFDFCPLEQELTIARDSIIRGLSNYQDNQKAFSKYHWIASQYNKLAIKPSCLRKKIFEEE